MNDDNSKNQLILKSLREQSKKHGTTTVLTSMQTLGGETTRYYVRSRETVSV